MYNIGNRIANLRKQADMSQTQLAKRLNVSNKTVSKWECGKSFPDIETLAKISKLFNISIDEIVSDEKVSDFTEPNENTSINVKKIWSIKKIRIILISVFGFILICITLLCYLLIPRKPVIYSSNLFDVNNEKFTLSCTVNNSQEKFSFYNTVNLPFNTKYKIYYDLIGNNELVSGTTPLYEGNNTFYMVVENSKGEKNTYTVIIRRRPKYKVTFDLGHDNEVYYQYIEENQFASEYKPSNRIGYIFNGWSYDFSKPIMGNITITANWIPIETLIDFNVNGGKEQIEPVFVNYGMPYDFAVPTKIGYDFVGWEYNNVLISNEMGNSNGNLTFIQPTTLIARWKPINYIILYHNVVGAINNNPNYYNISKQPLVLNDAERIGYTFNGWYSDDSFTQNVIEIPAGKTGEVNLYANWSINSYTLQFNSNGGSTIESIEKDYAEIITAPNPPTKKGFIFSGWYTDNSFSTLFVFDTMPAKSITLFAKWESRSGLIDNDGFIEIWDSDYIVYLSEHSNLWTNNFKLYADIDLKDIQLNPIGTKEHPFTGIFDGNYHTIINLSVNSITFNDIKYSESENSFISYMGLFGFCSGQIKNLYINNAMIEINYNTESLTDYYNLNLGILCGYAQNANITNISVLGTINLTTNISWIKIGGAIGYSKSCIINTSKSEVEIKINKTTTDKKYSNGAIYVGNFIGEDYYYTDGNQTEISNCYALGSINCNVTENTSGWLGGFLGGAFNNKLILTNCYSKCILTSKNCSFVNNFTPVNNANVVKNNCYGISGFNSIEESNLMNRQWVMDNLGWNEYDKNKIDEGYVWILVDNELPKLYWEIY